MTSTAYKLQDVVDAGAVTTGFERAPGGHVRIQAAGSRLLAELVKT
ncbi:hypothetical protein [Nocardioides furvisabuli]|nr:hypothetical protein [Nocardioides furvisabuli]